MARSIFRYLVVSAVGDIKVSKRSPRLKYDEVAYPIRVQIPELWGKVLAQNIDLTLPDPKPPVVEVGEAVSAS